MVPPVYKMHTLFFMVESTSPYFSLDAYMHIITYFMRYCHLLFYRYRYMRLLKNVQMHEKMERNDGGFVIMGMKYFLLNEDNREF